MGLGLLALGTYMDPCLSVAVGPNDEERILAYAKKLRELGRTEEALALLQQADVRFADSADWQIEFAVMLVYLDRRDDAIDRYRKGVALRPDEPRRLVELAMLLLERRTGSDLEDAWRLAGRAASLAPDEPIVLVCKAELLALRGDLREAGRLYDRAINGLAPASAQRRIYEKRAAALGRTVGNSG